MFDGDKAGAAATIRAIKTAIQWQMDVYVVPLDCDPDEHQGSFEEIEAVEYLTRQIKGTPNEIAEHIRDVCTAIQDPITAKIYSKKFADQYGVSQSDIESMISYRSVDLDGVGAGVRYIEYVLYGPYISFTFAEGRKKSLETLTRCLCATEMNYWVRVFQL